MLDYEIVSSFHPHQREPIVRVIEGAGIAYITENVNRGFNLLVSSEDLQQARQICIKEEKRIGKIMTHIVTVNNARIGTWDKETCKFSSEVNDIPNVQFCDSADVVKNFAGAFDVHENHVRLVPFAGDNE